MSESSPLTIEVFNMWREQHDKKIDHVVQFCDTQTAINLDIEGRVSSMEAKQEASLTRTTVISSVVAAIIGAGGAVLASLIGKH
jgi:hypothetical protein